MSPSWLEALRDKTRRESRDILLAPYGVSFARHRAGAATETLTLDCDGAPGNWEPALATMTAGVRQLAWRDTAVRIRLSNHFVRYAIVPMLAQLRGREERMLAARHQLSAIYGERAQRWQVALNDRRGARSAIVAGAEQSLLQQLVQALSTAQLNVATVEPIVATAFNALRRELRKTPTWLAVAEPGRIALAYIENLEWRFLQVERLRDRLEEALHPLLARTSLAIGAQPGRVLLVSDVSPDLRLPGDDGWSLDWRPLDVATQAGGATA